MAAISAEELPDVEDEVEKDKGLNNPKQQTILEKINALIFSNRNIYMAGFGGSGKSHQLRELAVELKNQKRKISCTASTGRAAVGYSETKVLCGSTLHHWAGVGLAKESEQELLKIVRTKRNVVKRIKETEILLIDEISMIPADLWDKLDFVLQRIRENMRPMGGIICVVCGDMMQLSPIHGEWIFKSSAWKACNFYPMIFNENYRFKDDHTYFELLQRCRFGRCLPEDSDLLRTRIKIKTEENDNDGCDSSKIKPTALFPTKKQTDDLNRQEMDKLPGVVKVYSARDIFMQSLNAEENIQLVVLRAEAKLKTIYDRMSPSEAETIQKTGMEKYVSKSYGTAPIPASYLKMLDNAIPKELSLKEGAQVMIKQNLSVEAGIVNGTRAVVIKLCPNNISVRIKSGRVIDISRNTWSVGIDGDVAVRSQFPLILAWGLTIHASQGDTLDAAECDVGLRIFAPGQAYVALSRVRSLGSLSLLSFNPRAIKCDPEAAEYMRSLEVEEDIKTCKKIKIERKRKYCALEMQEPFQQPSTISENINAVSQEQEKEKEEEKQQQPAPKKTNS